MLLNSKQCQFILLFPPNFFADSIKEKYRNYYKRLMLPYREIDEFMSSTVQSVDFPGMTIEGPQQIRMYGAQQEFKGSKPIKDLIRREFTVKFKLTDGFMNYFIYMDNALSFLDFDNSTQYFDTFTIGLLNNEGYLLNTLKLHKVLLNSISEFNLSYAEVSENFNTFESKFTYMDWDIEVYYDKMLNITNS